MAGQHAMLFTLLLVACVLQAVTAAAAKGGRSRHDPDFPQPVMHGKPCHIKSPECVDTYTEADAKRLAEMGYFGQVAIAPDLPPSLTRDLRSKEKPKHKRKATCRGEDGVACRRPQRKRGGEGRKNGGEGEGAPRKGRKGSRKGQRGEQDPSKPPKSTAEEKQARKERKQQRRKQRPNAPPPPSPPDAASPSQQ